MLRITQRLPVIALVAGAMSLAVAAAEELSRADADSVSTKIMRIEEAAAKPRAAGARPVRTTFTEREINAYFEYYGPELLPPGIAKPQVAIGDSGSIMARAIVDLDAVRLAHERSVLDPLAFVTGSVEVIASGIVAGTDGFGIVRFESATVAGVTVPKAVAQELLRFYTRSPTRPNGFEFDTLFALPGGVRSVVTDLGQATIVQ